MFRNHRSSRCINEQFFASFFKINYFFVVVEFSGNTVRIFHAIIRALEQRDPVNTRTGVLVNYFTAVCVCPEEMGLGSCRDHAA